MADTRRLLELAINGLKAQAADIANEIDLLEKELALAARQGGQGVARLAKTVGQKYNPVVTPVLNKKQRKRRLTAAQRQVHSQAMRAYWARRRAKEKKRLRQ